MSQLDIFSLDGRVAAHPGRRRRHRLGAGRGPRRGRRPGRRGRPDAGDPRRHGRAGRGPPAPRASRSSPTRRTKRTATGWSGRRSSGSAGSTSSSTRSAAAPARSLHPAESYPRSDWDWIMELNVRSTVVADPGRRARDDRPGWRRADPEHLVGAGEPRHQRRLLGLCRREGRDQLADPPVGDRVGASTTSGSTRSCRPSSTRPRSRCCSRTRRSRPASSTGSRSAASARPATSSGPAIFLCSDAASFVTGQVLGIDGGLTATQ